MTKLAAIYIRVSTQAQKDGASLPEQERLCREYAERKGYQVVKVYQDIGSATGTKERPNFLEMLQDAGNQVFDVLLAWREDRLYRGYLDTGFMELMRLVQSDTISIELENENFDKTMAVIKAAMAEEENRARVERMHMGVKARLRDGKHWGIEKKYGYTLNDRGEPIIEETEAHWVKQIYDWYLAGVGVREISRRLIAEGAPQKIGSAKGKPSWPTPIIYRILNDTTYSTGIHEVKRAGETFYIPVPDFIETEKYNETQKRKRKNINNPKGSTKYNYLLRGLLYSPCEVKFGGYTRKKKQTWTKKTTGETLSYMGYQHTYRCSRDMNTGTGKNSHHPDCPRTKGVVRLDQAVWEKVSEVLRNPDLLVSAANERLEELKEQHQDATKRKAHLTQRLQKFEDERQAFIELFGKSVRGGGHFSEDDLNRELDRIADETLQIKRELAQIELLSDTQFASLDKLVNSHLKEISAGLDWLDKEPETEEDNQRQFEERKTIVDLLVKRVTISKSADPIIEFIIDIPLQSELQDY